jgi:hypothetical protein
MRRPVPKQPQAVSKIIVSGLEYGFLPDSHKTGQTSYAGLFLSSAIVSGLEYGFLPDSRRTGQTSRAGALLSSGIVSKGGVRLSA